MNLEILYILKGRLVAQAAGGIKLVVHDDVGQQRDDDVEDECEGVTAPCQAVVKPHDRVRLGKHFIDDRCADNSPDRQNDGMGYHDPLGVTSGVDDRDGQAGSDTDRHNRSRGQRDEVGPELTRLEGVSSGDTPGDEARDDSQQQTDCCGESEHVYPFKVRSGGVPRVMNTIITF